MTSPLSSAPGQVAVITGGAGAIGTATAYPAIAASFKHAALLRAVIIPPGADPRPFQDRLRVGSRCVAWCCDVIMSGVPDGPGL
jgi:NAD(P)-dependent dehydrogenase (short-subunit alcohol dehydrogenase family)